jgi:hypothetical protein
MSRAMVEGRLLWLCLEHATAVVVAMPETFEQLRALFAQPATADPSGGPRRLDAMVERRSPLPRRRAEDRRFFPPRPEGRRTGFGRRADDPVD